MGNILGILIWFGPPIPCQDSDGRGVLCSMGYPGWSYFWPVPFPYKKANGKQLQMRDIPLNLARALGRSTRVWQTFPVYYILFMFVALPGLLFGISSLFEGNAAFQALGVVLSTLIVLVFLRILWFGYKQDGFNKITTYMESRQKRTNFRKSLMEVIPALEARIEELESAIKK